MDPLDNIDQAIALLREKGDESSQDATHLLRRARQKLKRDTEQDMTIVLKVDTAYTTTSAIVDILDALTGVLVTEVHHERMTSGGE